MQEDLSRREVFDMIVASIISHQEQGDTETAMRVLEQGLLQDAFQDFPRALAAWPERGQFITRMLHWTVSNIVNVETPLGTGIWRALWCVFYTGYMLGLDEVGALQDELQEPVNVKSWRATCD